MVGQPHARREIAPAAGSSRDVKTLAAMPGRSGMLLTAVTLAAILVPFAVPLLRGLYPSTADGILHLVRLIGLDHAVRNGLIWPRFLPALHYGYGSPIFNYCGPISLYPALLLRWAGLSFADAILGATVLWGAFGMLGAYRFGRTLQGQGAGFVLAAAFLYSAHLYLFGNFAQFAAAAFLPWLFWSLWRLAHRYRRRDFALSVIFLAAPVVTHNVTALITAGLAVLYMAFLVWHSDRRREAALLLGAVFAGAVGVTAFLWLPALVEQPAVQLERLAFFDFRNYFVSLSRLFSPGRETLHWPQLVLGAVAVWGAFSRPAGRTGRSALVVFLLVVLALLVFLMLPVSTPLWEAIPLMPYIEFPWRFLIPASLVLATLAALGATWIAPQEGRALWFALCIGAIIAYNVPLLDLEYHDPQPQAATVLDAHAIERTTGWLSGTSAGEYLPAWVGDRQDSWAFTERFAESEVFPRLAPAEGVAVRESAWGPVSGTVRVEAAAPTTLVFEWFYFPGWRARLDGEAAAVSPVGEYGLIGVEVPAGEHEVSVRFGLTPLRRGAALASLAALGATAAFAWRWAGFRREPLR